VQHRSALHWLIAFVVILFGLWGWFGHKLACIYLQVCCRADCKQVCCMSLQRHSNEYFMYICLLWFLLTKRNCGNSW
jgi:hypothetical protein